METKIKEQPSVGQAEDVASKAGDGYQQYDATIADVTITDSGLPTSNSQQAENTAVAIAQTKIPPFVTAKTLENLGYPTTYSRAIVCFKSSEPRAGVVRSGKTVMAYAFINNAKLLPGQSRVISSNTDLATQPTSSVPETIEIVRIRITSNRSPQLDKAA